MFWFDLMGNRWFAWMNVLTLAVMGVGLSVLAVAAALDGLPAMAAGCATAAGFFGVGVASAWLRFLSRGAAPSDPG